MDAHLQFTKEKRIERTLKAFEKNRIKATYLDSQEKLIEALKERIEKDSVVAAGGSMTLEETGVFDYLKGAEITFLDRQAPGLGPDEIREIYLRSFGADVYLTSTNALTEEGELYNVDGRGNRVAAMIYGPKKVIVVAGTNKIVKDFQEAVDRNERLAAPANNHRLDRKTPCRHTGLCSDCDSPERICNVFVRIGRQLDPDRMEVLLVEGQWGY